MAYVFEVVEDGLIPQWLQEAYDEGYDIQVLTSIGWIDVEDQCDIDFRNGVTYRVKP